MTDKDLKTISKKIDSLHNKILNSKFAESVAESEVMSLILAVHFLNRQQAEIERLNKECDELVKKIEQLLCNVTGDKLSKHTYPIEDMLCYADDYTNECCEEAVEEAKPSIKSEAVKEFAERLCKGRVSNDPVVIAVKAEL